MAGTPPALGDGARLARGLLDDRGEAFEGLMRRQHIVVCGDDPDVGKLRLAENALLGGGEGGEGMSEVGARQVTAHRSLPARLVEAPQVSGATVLAAMLNPLGYGPQGGMNAHDVLRLSQES